MNKEFFQNRQDFSSDIYVGDYTEYAKTHTKKRGTGVVFSSCALPDLNTLHIKNPNRKKVTAVNFEECPGVFADECDRQEKQCEDLCYASRARKHGWVLLIEMKYCQEKNVGTNVDTAKLQLKKTLEFLRNEKHVIEEKDRVYWVLSIPDHGDLAPFGSFVYTPSDLLELQESLNVIAFFRCNEIEIRTDSHLAELG